ncbi:hypothetical protein L1887_26094 [Cichorium endivia]|nr:hypothetical protein L1887_26094 [Cichorium endivia]
MIRDMMVINNQGKPRLAKFYNYVASDGVFVRRSAASMLSSKKPVAAAFKDVRAELKVSSSSVQFKEPHF